MDDTTGEAWPLTGPHPAGPCQECGRPLPTGTMRYCVHCGAEVAVPDAVRNNELFRPVVPPVPLPPEPPGATWSTGEFRAPSPLDGVPELPSVAPATAPLAAGAPVSPAPAAPAPASLPPRPADAWYSDAWAVEALPPLPGAAPPEPATAVHPVIEDPVLEGPAFEGPVVDRPVVEDPTFRSPRAVAFPMQSATLPAPPVPPQAVDGGWPAPAPLDGVPDPSPRRARWPVLPLVAAGLVLVVGTTFGLLWLASRGSDDVTAAPAGQPRPASAAASAAPADLPPSSAPAGPDAAPAVASGEPSDEPSPRATAAIPTTATDLVTALDGLLDASTAARGDVAATAAGLQSCRVPAGRAAGVFRAAEAERNRLATEATALSVGADATLAGAGDVVRAFIALQRASAQADDAFADWADAVAAAGCRGQAQHTPDWDLANRYSADATQAKTRFVSLWNPIASAHGGRPRTADTI